MKKKIYSLLGMKKVKLVMENLKYPSVKFNFLLLRNPWHHFSSRCSLIARNFLSSGHSLRQITITFSSYDETRWEQERKCGSGHTRNPMSFHGHNDHNHHLERENWISKGERTQTYSSSNVLPLNTRMSQFQVIVSDELNSRSTTSWQCETQSI